MLLDSGMGKAVCGLMRVVLGIDPGLQGAIAAINPDSTQILGLEDTPTLWAEGKTIYNVAEMAALIRRFALMGDTVAILEQAQAMPGQGVSSTFSTGYGYGFGLWSGILATLEIPYRTVRPSVWTRKVLHGAPGEGKARTIAWASRMFPSAELVPPGCRKPRDGRADALGLAVWGATT